MSPYLTLFYLAAPLQGNISDSVGPQLQRLADSVVAGRPRLPGLIIYVRAGALGREWQTASGWSDTAGKVPLGPDRPLRIASNTKTYVAAAILRLAERGILSLHDPLAAHLPASLNALLVRDGYRTDVITIEQVLSHRAGLAEHPEVPSYGSLLETMPNKRWTREEQLRWLVDSLQPVGEPGAQFKYSDSGYLLLGAILEHHTGKNLGAAVRELVGLDRLGLRRTWFETLEPTPVGVLDRAHQYMRGLDTYRHDPSFDLYGGGGIVAPLKDVGGFLESLLGGRVFERKATLDTMLRARSPDLGGYGLGVFATETAGHRGFGHSGFWGTIAFYYPNEKVTIAVAATEQSQGGVIFSVVDAVWRILSLVDGPARPRGPGT